MMFFPILLVVGWIFYRASERERRREIVEHERWWRDYRERERITDLQHAWLARFRRREDETEDEFVARFKDWLYACDLRDDHDVG